MALNFFLSYSRKDSSFLTKSTFLDFTKHLVTRFGGQLFWDQDDHHSIWKEALQDALDKMDVFLALVSQPFLVGDWTQKEVEIAIKRQHEEHILVIPIMLSESQWEGLAWLENTARVPKNGSYIDDPRNRNRRPACFKAIADEIKELVKTHYRLPNPKPWSDVVRRLSEKDLKSEAGTLRRRARQEAKRLIPDAATRTNIIRAAERIRESNGDRPLSRDQLRDLDRRFVARGGRKPDPKYARWVLRGVGLHPQGNYRSRG